MSSRQKLLDGLRAFVIRSRPVREGLCHPSEPPEPRLHVKKHLRNGIFQNIMPSLTKSRSLTTFERAEPHAYICPRPPSGSSCVTESDSKLFSPGLPGCLDPSLQYCYISKPTCPFDVHEQRSLNVYFDSYIPCLQLTPCVSFIILHLISFLCRSETLSTYLERITLSSFPGLSSPFAL